MTMNAFEKRLRFGCLIELKFKIIKLLRLNEIMIFEFILFLNQNIIHHRGVASK
jgi:hypothetical protein